MVRRYADRPVEPDLVNRILEHATRAPSAGFTQAVEFVLLDTPSTTQRFWATTCDPGASNSWLDGMRTAPVVIVPVTSRDAYLDRYAEPDKAWTDRDEARWPVPYWYVDAGMSALLILQGAVDAGLGACFFGIPPERLEALCRELGLPDTHEPIGAITLGHPDPTSAGSRGSPAHRRRRQPEEVVHRGSWSGPFLARELTESDHPVVGMEEL